MKRRDFLKTAVMAGATLPFAPRTHNFERRKAVRTWAKGVHLAPGFNPALVNQLGLDYVEGIDPMLFAVMSDPLGCGISQLNCRYRHRMPKYPVDSFDYNQVQKLPNFHDEWVVLNEPALYDTPQLAAAYSNAIVETIVSYNPNANNWFDLNFLMQDQYQDNAWRNAFWDALTPFTISKISVLGIHVYPWIVPPDPIETRSMLKNSIRNWQNSRGIGHFPLLLHETGFPAAAVTQEQAETYIYQFAEDFEEVVWLDGVNWFMASETVDMHYVPLVNPQQTKLKRAGVAWAAI
jgi:hypothetical protein